MLFRIATSVLLAAVCGVRLGAQSNTPTGLAAISVAAGGGSGALKITCRGCAPTYRAISHSALVTMARVSYAISAQSIIGIEYDNWRRTSTFQTTDPVTLDLVPVEQTTSADWIDATVQWYPVSHGALTGLHIKGAFGLTTLTIGPGTTRARSTGGGAGLGWDIWFTKLLAVTPSYDMLSAQRAEYSGQRATVTHPAIALGTFMTSYGVTLKFKGIP